MNFTFFQTLLLCGENLQSTSISSPPNSKKMANIFKTNTSGVTSPDINTTGLYEGHASLMFISMEPGGLKLEGIQWLAVGSCDSQKKTKQPFSWEGMWTHKHFCSLSDYPCKKITILSQFPHVFWVTKPSAKPFLRHFPGKCWWPHRTNKVPHFPLYVLYTFMIW